MRQVKRVQGTWFWFGLDYVMFFKQAKIQTLKNKITRSTSLSNFQFVVQTAPTSLSYLYLLKLVRYHVDLKIIRLHHY